MQFREDLIRKFLRDNGRTIHDERNYMSGTGNYIYECYTNNGEKWIFQDWHKCTRYIHLKKAVNTEKFNMEWQKFAICSTSGCQQDCVIEAIRKDGRNKLDYDLDYLCYWNMTNGYRRDTSIETYGEVRVQSLLQAERLKIKYNLLDSRTASDFAIVSEGLWHIRAEYNHSIQEKINDFYERNEIFMTVDENGEYVPHLNEQQQLIVNRMNNIKDRFDELFKEGLYLLDQRELEMFGERE